MVEVFKTNIREQEEAAMLAAVLSEQFPSLKINFDLDDCDKILRICGENILPDKIIEILNANNYQCSVLD